MYLLTLVSPDVDAEFEQLAVDARRTLSGILAAHPADQISDLTPNLRSSRLPRRTFQVQEKTEALAMPNDHRVRLNHNQRRAPVAPDVGQPGPDSQAHDGRSTGVNLGRFLAERCSTPIW